VKRRASAILAVPAFFGFALLVLPAIALAIRTPWHRLGSIISQVEVRQALVLSFITSICATFVALVLGVPLAWWLAHGSKKLARVLRSLVLMPLVMPPVVGGVALLQLLGRRGVIGGPLYRWTGYSIPFTTVAVVIAEAFVAMPFLVLAVEGAFTQVPPALEARCLELAPDSCFAGPGRLVNSVRRSLLPALSQVGRARCRLRCIWRLKLIRPARSRSAYAWSC
jgi:molybdate transport system permease protein